jgi:mono/diheme cytochrome c family protein
MFIRRFGAAAGLLLFASVSSGQTDRAAQAERQKTPDSPQQKDSPGRDNPGDTLAALRGRTPVDKEAAERGRKIFVPTCGFCHGNDAQGKSGPDLVRSPLVLHDNKGDVIGPVIREGRPDRGMPALRRSLRSRSRTFPLSCTRAQRMYRIDLPTKLAT